MPDASMPAPHIHQVRVYFEDTDAGGIVYYANYLRFAERARSEMLRTAGIESSSLLADQGAALAVKNCSAEYHRPARLDDLLDIHTRVAEIGGATITLSQDVRRGDELLVSMMVRLACIGIETGAPRRLPEGLRHKFDINHTINSNRRTE
ncbi:MAG: tol-pal system-associated acyl-CoA thioesterase [Proteobacteria bacterium]|nr:tol-pal system-associated acyl-CoA thioesterase [Pseudomonadota bacterium]